jgi:hypothetical protein
VFNRHINPLRKDVFNMAARAGLVGIYQPPTIQGNPNSVYMIADENNDSLYVFILFPGAYDTAYAVASCTWYRNIFIVPVSLDGLYVSDVARLVNDLAYTKHIVRVLYPGKFSAFVPTVVQKALINSNRKTYYQYTNGFISFNYRIDSDVNYQPNFYDIYATFKTRRCLFCPFEVNKDRILKMIKAGDVDWVYVPYSDPMFGTDSYATLVIDSDFEDYMDKIIAFGFHTEDQVNYCKGRYPKSFPRNIKNEFLQPFSTFETGYPPVVGGNVTIAGNTTTSSTDESNDVNKTPFPAPFPKPIPPEDPAINITLDENTVIEIGTETTEG